MFNLMIKSKISRAIVTDGNLAYQGSITIDKKLMDAAGIKPYEYVHINNINNAAHWETYAIPGNHGEIILNGPPARLFQPGDPIVILSFLFIGPNEFDNFKHRDVFVNNKNEIVKINESSCSNVVFQQHT